MVNSDHAKAGYQKKSICATQSTNQTFLHQLYMTLWMDRWMDEWAGG